MKKTEPIFGKVLTEQNQGHETRIHAIKQLEKILDRPVVSFFTSFNYPVMMENSDVDMLEGVLQKMNLDKGLVLLISSPGGNGLAAERIINVCRSYSGTKEFWALVPGKAKSAATMVCFGASGVYMGPVSELGPIDPQITVPDGPRLKRFSLWNTVKSYNDLFEKAVKAKGNLQPYLQQLANYDAREIIEFKDAISLSEDIAIKALKSGMLSSKSNSQIKKDIDIFLSPKTTKAHGRPICRDEAKTCGLNIKSVNIKDKLWPVMYELYVRGNNFVSTRVAKCVESSEYSYIVRLPK